jgi:predicted transcriptional regulator
MTKHSAFTVELEPDLREALAAEAEAAGRPAGQIVRDLIDDYVRRQRDARAHDAWFRGQVEQALREADDPTVERIPNGEVEASWEHRRAELLQRLGVRGLGD